jgi:NADH dehydrogenase FAD-containing subunit
LAFNREQLAQVAVLHAAVCAKNIKKVEQGKSLHCYEPKARIKIVSTGCNKAIMYMGNTILQEGEISGKIKQFLRAKTFKQINK